MSEVAGFEGSENVTRKRGLGGVAEAVLPYFRLRPIAALLLGISSGFPLALLLGTMTFWLAKVGIEKKTIGFNVDQETYVDMFDAGIIDPTKVSRSALQNAASVAGLLLTTEALIAEIPEKKKAPAMPGGGGYGGEDF